MAQDEWTQFYEQFSGHSAKDVTALTGVPVASFLYDNGFYEMRLHNNGQGPAIYVKGAGVDHLFIPQDADAASFPYNTARVVSVNGEGVETAVLNALADAKKNPVKSNGEH